MIEFPLRCIFNIFVIIGNLCIAKRWTNPILCITPSWINNIYVRCTVVAFNNIYNSYYRGKEFGVHIFCRLYKSYHRMLLLNNDCRECWHTTYSSTFRETWKKLKAKTNKLNKFQEFLKQFNKIKLISMELR